MSRVLGLSGGRPCWQGPPWLEGWLDVIRVVGHLGGRRHLARTGQGSKAKLRNALQ